MWSQNQRKQKSEESAIVRAPQSRDRFFCFDWLTSLMRAIFLCIEQGSEGPQNNADWLILWRPGKLTTEKIQL